MGAQWAKRNLFVVVYFYCLGFPSHKISRLLDREVSITSLYVTFSSQLVVMWSVRVEVWHVILVVCFKPKIEQIYAYFLGIAPKLDFLLLISLYLSKMLFPLSRIFILVLPRIKRSFSIRLKSLSPLDK